MDCLRRNLEGTGPDLRMSEVREVEESKINPMFLVEVHAAGVQLGKGEEGELRLGDAEFVVVGDREWGQTHWNEEFGSHQHLFQWLLTLSAY